MQTTEKLDQLAIERGVCSLGMSKKLNWQMLSEMNWHKPKEDDPFYEWQLSEIPFMFEDDEKDRFFIISAPSVGDLFKTLIVEGTFSMDLWVKLSGLKEKIAQNEINLADVLAEFYIKTKK